MKSKNNFLNSHRNKTLASVLFLGSTVFSTSASGEPFFENFDIPLNERPSYEPIFEARERGKSAVYENSQVTFRLDFSGEGRNRVSLADTAPTDAISATLTVSSESRIDPDSRFRAEVSGTLYNEIQDGGNDGATGDVFATTRIFQDDEGLKTLFCAFRSDNANFSEVTVLGANGTTECGEFSFTPAHDTPYHASVSLNREEQTLEFQLNEEMHIIALSSELFLPSNYFTRVRAQVDDGTGLAVVGVDDLKTDNIDDSFNYDTTPILLVREFGEGVFSGEVVNEALELSASTTGSDQARSRMDVLGKVNESISTVVNVSSGSASEGQILARLNATVFNTGTIYNPDSPTDGNVVATNDIIFEENGRNRVSVCHAESLGGAQQNQICDEFNKIPTLDTDYNVSITVDRENSAIIFGLDEEIIEMDITTPMNDPFESIVYVSADNNFAAGTAVAIFDDLRVDCTAESSDTSCLPRTLVQAETDVSTDSSDGSGGGSLGWGLLLLLTIGFRQNLRGEKQ